MEIRETKSFSKLLGVDDAYVVSGDCGYNYNEALRELKAELRRQHKKVRSTVIVKAIVFVEDKEE